MQTHMYIVRGGHLETVPVTYLPRAIYNYNYQSYNYACMGTQMLYWTLRSLIGRNYVIAFKNSVEFEALAASKVEINIPWDLQPLCSGQCHEAPFPQLCSPQHRVQHCKYMYVQPAVENVPLSLQSGWSVGRQCLRPSQQILFRIFSQRRCDHNADRVAN